MSRQRMPIAAVAAVLALAGAAHGAEVTAGLGEVIVTANRQNARYAQPDRPLIGVRRPADGVARSVSFSSDARDEAVRTREVHGMLLAALDRAAAASVELVTGSFELVPVTRANYQALPMLSAGRIDTSRVTLMVKTRLDGTKIAAESRLATFINDLPRNGRGAIDWQGEATLTIVNPDQYRGAIVAAVAEDARRQAAVFGADYAVQVTGIDGQVSWSQVSASEVFLHVPYRYTIVPR